MSAEEHERMNSSPDANDPPPELEDTLARIGLDKENHQSVVKIP